jgi:hypothetical protein
MQRFEKQNTYLFHNFFKHVNVSRENVQMLDGNAADLTEVGR